MPYEEDEPLASIVGRCFFSVARIGLDEDQAQARARTKTTCCRPVAYLANGEARVLSRRLTYDFDLLALVESNTFDYASFIEIEDKTPTYLG